MTTFSGLFYRLFQVWRSLNGKKRISDPIKKTCERPALHNVNLRKHCLRFGSHSSLCVDDKAKPTLWQGRPKRNNPSSQNARSLIANLEFHTATASFLVARHRVYRIQRLLIMPPAVCAS